MLPLEDIAFQLLDLPSMSPDHSPPWIASSLQSCDAVLLVVDLSETSIDSSLAGAVTRGGLVKGLRSGPRNKADLRLALEGAPARERLSRGEQKAMTAALIIAQASTICATGEKPVLLLDDLFSEFDDEHLARVLASAMELGVQVWLTGTRAGPAIEVFKGAYSMFHVEHGKVIEVSA